MSAARGPCSLRYCRYRSASRVDRADTCQQKVNEPADPHRNCFQPLRVAVIARPATFYAVEHLFKQTELVVERTLFDRLRLRTGGSLWSRRNHLKIKTVTRVYDSIAATAFSFLGTSNSAGT